MTRHVIRVCLFIAVASSAQANILVFEGVDFSASTGLYTYHYALDNRAGTKSIDDFGILVLPGVFASFPPLPHTSPPGWNLVTSVGGQSVGGGGTFQEWYTNFPGLAPGQYLSGFSFSTPHPPRSSTTVNYYVFSPQSPPDLDFLEKGSIEAPELNGFIPALGTLAKLMLMIAVAAAGSFVLLRRT